jgi:hypothetical protein
LFAPLTDLTAENGIRFANASMVSSDIESLDKKLGCAKVVLFLRYLYTHAVQLYIQDSQEGYYSNSKAFHIPLQQQKSESLVMDTEIGNNFFYHELLLF